MRELFFFKKSGVYLRRREAPALVLRFCKCVNAVCGAVFEKRSCKTITADAAGEVIVLDDIYGEKTVIQVDGNDGDEEVNFDLEEDEDADINQMDSDND